MIVNPTEEHIAKNVMTRDGAKVMLWAYLGSQERPYFGAYFAGENWIPCTWDANGLYNSTRKPCGMDLIILKHKDKEAA